MILSRSAELATAMGLHSDNKRIKSQLLVASKEVATGINADLIQASGRNLTLLFSVERSISEIETLMQTNLLAKGKIETTQMSLELIQKAMEPSGVPLLSAVGRDDLQSMQLISGAATGVIDEVISALNVDYARHNVFSGAALDRNAFAPSAILLTDIDSIVSAATNVASMISGINSYFSPGGGFDSNFYLGSTENGPAQATSNGQVVDYSVKGDSDAFRSTFKSLAILAVSTRPPIVSGSAEQMELVKLGAELSMKSTEDIVSLRGKMGVSEAHVSKSQANDVAMLSVLELQRHSIISVDQYEAATRFEALQGQIESVYTMTARLSNLSLVNFLR